jgi:hypothetical protein
VNDGLLGHDQHVLRRRHVERDVDVHVRAERVPGIRQLDRDLHGPGLLAEERIDVAHAADDPAARLGGHLHDGSLTDLEPGHLVLVDLRLGPDLREVDDLVEVHARLDGHAFERLTHLLDDQAVGRRDGGERAADGARALQFVNLGVADVPVGEPLAAGLDERAGAPGRLRIVCSGHALRVIDGLQVLVLRRDELGTVDLEQLLSLPHRLADVVDVHALDPPVELGVDPHGLPVVVCEGADRADGEGNVRAPHRLRLHADVLHESRIDADHAGRRSLLLVLVHRHEIHAHGRLAGCVPDVGRIHRRPPVLDLPLRGLCVRLT